MSGLRRFFALGQENSVFRFRIDTTKTVVGATNGSQNPLTFKIPVVADNTYPTAAIIKISDGRPDVSMTNANINTTSLISFTTAGTYYIEIIGKVGAFVGFGNGTVGYDRLKMIGIYLWPYQIIFYGGSFKGCSNLVIYAENTFKLPSVSNTFFEGIGGFYYNRLDNLVFTDVTSAIQILLNVPNIFTSLFNPFMPSMTTASSLYLGLDLTALSKVEIISDTITNVGSLFGTPVRAFYGELIISTPNNTNIQALGYYFSITPSFAKVDIRSVTSALNFIRYPMTKSRTDDTLLGWANNYDWSTIPNMPNKVTLDFKGSTHSNTAPVNAAKAFLVAKGYVFTNLTAV